MVEKISKFLKSKKVLLSVKWIAQIHVLSNISCWVGKNENLICPSESSSNENAKIGIGLICSSCICTSWENLQNVFTKKSLDSLMFVVNCNVINFAAYIMSSTFPTRKNVNVESVTSYSYWLLVTFNSIKPARHGFDLLINAR